MASSMPCSLASIETLVLLASTFASPLDPGRSSVAWNEVRTDPKLLDWVRRENYFDSRLPEGWQQYLDIVYENLYGSESGG